MDQKAATRRNSSQSLPEGVEIRAGKRRESLRVTFTFNSERCRETLDIPVTPANIKYAGNLRGEIKNRIERGTFVYEEHFPDSRIVKISGDQSYRISETPEKQRSRLAAKQRIVTVNERHLRSLNSRSKEQILATSRFSPVDHCGVYFLIIDEEIAYVGQSTNIHRRVSEHFRDSKRDGISFDSYTYVLCKPSELDALEAIYIEKFAPEWNVRAPYSGMICRLVQGAAMGQSTPNNTALNILEQKTKTAEEARKHNKVRRLKAV